MVRDASPKSQPTWVALLTMRPIESSRVSTIIRARLLEMLHHLGAQRGLLVGAPLAEPFAGLEAKFALGHELFKVRRGAGARLDVRQHGPVDRKRQVGADGVGVLE